MDKPEILDTLPLVEPDGTVRYVHAAPDVVTPPAIRKARQHKAEPVIVGKDFDAWVWEELRRDFERIQANMFASLFADMDARKKRSDQRAAALAAGRQLAGTKPAGTRCEACGMIVAGFHECVNGPQ